MTITSAATDPDTSDNAFTLQTNLDPTADLKITKFGKPDEIVRAGELLTYTVIVDNLGPSWAGGVAVKDILQSDKRFDLVGIDSDRPFSCASVPSGAPGGIVDIDQRLVVDCFLEEDLAVLSAGLEQNEGPAPTNPGRWILTLTVTAPQTSDLDNVAVVTADVFVDPDTANNQAYVEHSIADVSDLEVINTAKDLLLRTLSLGQG